MKCYCSGIQTFLQFRFGPGESMFDKQPGEKSTLERKVMCSCSQHTSIITKDKGILFKGQIYILESDLVWRI